MPSPGTERRSVAHHRSFLDGASLRRIGRAAARLGATALALGAGAHALAAGADPSRILICPPSCDDADLCTTDYCDPTDGLCHHLPVTCNDGNPCTTDTCSPTIGCSFQNHPNGEACDDGTGCTTGDACQNGVCVGTPLSCDDGNPCTYDSCDNTAGPCSHYPIVCDDGNPCTDDSCSMTGQCVYVPRAVGAVCDDGNPCTSGTHCVASQQGVSCVGTETPGAACNDGQPCTTGDVCVPGTLGGTHCQGTYNTCDDGNACTGDFCDENGQCHHDPLDCNDGNACTNDSCNAMTGCQHVNLPQGTPCDDGEPCTTMDACKTDPRNGYLCAGTPTVGAPCNDPSVCTYHDVCVAGGRFGAFCQGTSVDCNDNNPCTTEFCDPSLGGCRVTRTFCNDGNTCTNDSCGMAGCQYAPRSDGSACDDFNSCTTTDICQTGFCAGTSLDCNDGNPCTNDSCLESGCVHTPVNCADSSACTADGCNPATGECTHTPLPDATPCTDGNPCTVGESCQTGQCLGSPISCDDANPCTSDFCDFMFGGCVHNPVMDGTACNDGTACTANDACAAGQCTGAPIDCSDGNPCTNDACLPATGACQHTPVLGEVTPLSFPNPTHFQWAMSSGGTHWNSYRGTIPAATLGSRLPGLVYNHVCFESADAFGDGALISTDAAKPPAGTAFYYDVTEEGTCGEGPLGSTTSGAVRPNFLPCPTPP